MKKKMGILGGLVMAVVVTAYSVAGTYAKYISTFDMADEARVAKWSFTDQKAAERTVDLFQASYSTDENGIYVATSDTSKVIAPGTEGLYEYNIVGTAETNYRVTKNIKIVNKVILATGANAWDKGKLLYNPVVFTIDGKEVTSIPTVEYDENGDAYIVYEVALNDTTVYPANHELSEVGSIAWKWEFETGTKIEDLGFNGIYTNDSLDTTLGERIAAAVEAGETDRYNITATVGITVEQTQDAPTNGEVTTAPVYVTTMIDADTNNYVLDTLGVDRATYSKVVFNGTALTGTIYSSKNEKTDRLMGNSATGYYYPLSITVDPATTKTITVKNTWVGQGHDSKYDVATQTDNGRLDLVYGLENGEDLVYVLDEGLATERTITIKNNLQFK